LNTTDLRPCLALEVYGDESEYENVVAYGLALVPVVRKAEIENAIVQVKARYGCAPEARIHCSPLFHAGTRSKSADWGDKLTKVSDVWMLLEQIVDAFFGAGGRLWAGILDIRAMPPTLLIEHPKGTHEAHETHVSHARLFAYQSAMAPVTDMVDHRRIATYLDPDMTKLQRHPLYGALSKRIKDHQGFFPMNHHNEKFEPRKVGNDKPLLLDIADITSYAASHAWYDPPRRDAHFFRALLNRAHVGFTTCHFLPIDGPVSSAQVVNEGTLREQREYFGKLFG